MVIKSPYPSIEIPDIHIYDLLFKTPLSEHSQPFSPLTSSDALATTRDDTYWATRDVLIDAQNGVKYTFPVLKQRIEKLAAALANTASDPRIPFNLGKGDVLALFSNNHIDFPVVTWATVRAGGIMTAANPAYTEPELEHQLRDSGAKIVVVSRPNVALTLKVARTLGIPAKNIVLIDSRTDSERLLGGVDAPICHLESHTFLTLHGLLSLSPASPLAPLSYTPSSIRTQTAYLMYSSGTTGKSKGVEQTHGNIVANIMQIQTSERGFLPTGEKMLGVLPFFHCYGLTWIGCPLVVMPGFTLPTFLSTLSTYNIHFAHLVPPIMVQMAKCPEEMLKKYDLSKLKWIVSGAAPMGSETGIEIEKRLKGARIRQGYGMTELAPVSIVEAYGPRQDDGSGCIGVLLPNQVARLVDPETGKDVAQGEEGELLIAGPNVMKGYYNRPDATAETMSGPFLRTGDLASLDERGRFYIRDRLKELIKVKGFQVPPAELEALLLTHPNVADCAVISIPDEVGTAGELPKAYVVERSKSANPKKAEKELQDYVAGKVAHYKRLTGGIEFVESVPKSASGKILRRVLRDMEKERREKVKAKL